MVRLTPVRSFLAAVQFLTRIPVRRSLDADLASTATWFPVVGALIGVGVGGILAGLQTVVPMSVAATVAVLAGLLITGAFHEDGLADMADAVAGGATVERRLEILEDPRHGSYGVAALCGTIIVRIIAVGSVPVAAAFAGLVAAHALSRGAAVVAMGTVRLARPDGLGAVHAGAVGRGRALATGGAAMVIGAIATGWWIGPLAGAAAIGAAAVAAVAVRSLGGITGDVLGGIEQVGECLVLVVVSGVAAHHVVWWG
ncbi:MAG: adenosylcobinamide-GDP ribazoletransferase [Ilumatobacteraceae bacterium]